MYRLMCLVGSGLACLQPATIGRICKILAVVVFDVLRIRRRLVLGNLKTAYGDELSKDERLRIGRKSVESFLLTSFEFIRAHRTDLARDVQFVGLDHIRKVLDRGDGAYILAMHMSNWEAMGAAITRCVRPVHTVVKKVGSDQVNQFVEEVRYKNGFLVIDRTERGEAYKAMRRILERGEMVGFAFDQARPGEPRVPFFGKPAKTNTSLAAFRQRVPAPVVPAFCHRVDVEKFVVEFLPELDLEVSGDRTADRMRHTEHFNRTIEEIVRRCPEQYFWMHNRWKE